MWERKYKEKDKAGMVLAELHQAQDELQVPIHNGFAIWGERHRLGHSPRLHGSDSRSYERVNEVLTS